MSPVWNREHGQYVLNLTGEEKKDLVAFLESLTGNLRFEPAGDDTKRATASVR